MFAIGKELRVRIDVGDEVVELGAGVGESSGDVYVEGFVRVGEEGSQEGSLCCRLVKEGAAEREGGEPQRALGSHVERGQEIAVLLCYRHLQARRNLSKQT